MATLSIRQKAAILNLFVLFILLADGFLLPFTQTRQIYNHCYTTNEESRMSERGYPTDHFLFMSGTEITGSSSDELSELDHINTGDTVYFEKSLLFKKIMILRFHSQSGPTRITLSPFYRINFTWSFVLSIVACLTYLLPWDLLKNPKWKERLIIYTSMFNAYNAIMYFIILQ
ncbi:MAG: hypothetical protein JST68_24020 [Bacteroidetes bacterium]|nr:hypothetical protein [Bacteroidota bacterium]